MKWVGKMKTFEKICEILAERFSIEKDEIAPETSVVNDLGADSLDVVELMMALEDEFSISVPEDDAAAFTCVGDIAEYIDSALQ